MEINFRSHVLRLVLTYAPYFTVVVHGKFIMQTPLSATDMLCLKECQFFQENQTIVIINSTDPKQFVEGVALYTTPIRMKDPATRTVASFNTTFTFREDPEYYDASPNVTDTERKNFKRGDGFTFVISNSSTWVGAPQGYLGIFSMSATDTPKVVAVEFDNYANFDTDPPLQEEHVGLDIARPNSVCISYITPLGISFWKRDEIYAWIEYDGIMKNLQVRVANTSSRPVNPLLSCNHDLYDAVDERMWIGFSGALGSSWEVYYIYNWTFASYGISPHFRGAPHQNPLGFIVGACGGSVLALFFLAVSVWLHLRRRRALDELWDMQGLVEMVGMPEFISYKHLSDATNRFSDQSKLGAGGFGSVYKGVLPKTGAQVAVKKVSNDSRQGEREFLAEVQIISQLRHRNVVQLTGFCRHRGKFLLVYELLPNGSLDHALFNPKPPQAALSWPQRWKIVSGTAAALHYLHEGWRLQVIHRDVKSSNIMLDDEYNPKLGDFGLARLVDHEKSHAVTTLVAGTYGYIAPEATGGRFTDKTDVFAFGAVALEVACGRRALDVRSEDDMILVDMVWRHMKAGALLGVADGSLLGEFDAVEMEKVLKLGLLCSHPEPGFRPSMRQVVQVLAGDIDVPELPESNQLVPLFSIDDLLHCVSGTTSRLESSKLLYPVSVATSNAYLSSSVVSGR